MTSTHRTRWAAIGAAIAITLGAGTLTTVNAVTSSGERAIYNPITACRLTDTRPASQVGPRSTPLGTNDTLTIAARGAQGDCTTNDLPTDATALALNVTTVGATLPTFLTFWPDGTRPNASSINPAPGQPPTPNAVTVPLSATGNFNVYNLQGNVNVIIDVVGFYTDHNHDDRYHTEAEADARFEPTQPDVVHPLLASGNSGGFTYQAGIWERPAAGGEACITFPVDVPDGRSVDRIEMTYSSDAATPAKMTFFSIDRTPQEYGTEVQVIRLHLATQISMPETNAVSDRTETFVFDDDPTVEPTLSRTTTLDNGTANVFFCTDSGPVSVLGLTVFLDPA